jgi:ParB/RepB/Spo0J family partition protein
MSRKKSTSKESTPMVHEVTLIPIHDIYPSPVQPRKNFGNLDTLAASMKAAGLLQAVVVREMLGKGYELVSGERRLRAAKLLKWDSIPAVVRELTDDEAHTITAVENLERDNLTPLEQARSIDTLLTAPGHTVADVADRLGRSPGWVTRRASLLNLSVEWQGFIEDEKTDISHWPASCLEVVARLNAEDQADMLTEYKIHRNVPIRTDLLEHVTHKYQRDITTAGFDTTDAVLLQGIGSCTECRARTGAQPDLFDDMEKAPEGLGRCLDLKCWMQKERASREQQFLQAKEKHGDELRTVAQGYYHANGSATPWSKAVDKARIKNEWEWQSCKRTEPGATPVLVVDGKDRGKVRFMKMNETALQRDERSKKREKENPVKVADAKRLELLAELVSKNITVMATADTLPKFNLSTMIAYVIVFGIDGCPGDNDFAQYDEVLTLKPAELEKKFAQRIAENIEENTWNWNGSEDDIRHVCDIMKLDYDALAEQALKDVPVPEAVEKPVPEKAAKKAKGKGKKS